MSKEDQLDIIFGILNLALREVFLLCCDNQCERAADLADILSVFSVTARNKPLLYIDHFHEYYLRYSPETSEVGQIKPGRYDLILARISEDNLPSPETDGVSQ